MTDKTTKRDVLVAIREAAENGVTFGDVTPDEVIAYCDVTMEQMDKKNAKAAERAKAKRAEADEVTDKIEAVLTAEPQTIADIIAAVDVEDLTPAKVAARMRKLIEAGKATKIPAKGKVGVQYTLA